ncbi:hypothetical protein ULB03_26520 [Nitrospirillum sp. BR 11828]|nr:hypothetical protein [Nitrospirillum sp. BR 11828]MDZ5650661.1 hypothetical protein [Nitrospirillum sp. BR 11828]
MFPKAKLLAYLEFFYNAHGADVGFDPEFPPVLDDVFRIRIKNSVLLHGLQAMDAGITPTRWQAKCLPPDFRRRVAIVHDGVDTHLVCPDPAATLTVTPEGASTPLVLRAGDEVITFVNRNLEPYRGFHTFLRALPELMRRRPNAQVVIVGGTTSAMARGRKTTPIIVPSTWRRWGTNSTSRASTSWARCPTTPSCRCCACRPSMCT